MFRSEVGRGELFTSIDNCSKQMINVLTKMQEYLLTIYSIDQIFPQVRIT